MRHRAERLAGLEAAVDDAHERDHAAVLVVGGVEDERARRARSGRPRGAGSRSTIASSTSSTPCPVFAEMRTHVARAPRRAGRRHLGRGAVRIGRRQVDLVHDRDDLEVVLDREVRVRERLRLDPLRRVDDEQRALAGLQRARHLVGEVDVPGRVDQVELVPLPAHAHGLRLDRDARARARGPSSRAAARACRGRPTVSVSSQDAVGERRLAVVDVRDDREVADAALVHGGSAGS